MFSFENCLAAERFAPYQNAHTSFAQQRELYLWNSELSQEMNKAIGHAEIFIREAIDQQLCTWNLNQPQQPGMTHNQTSAPLHHSDPRRRPSGGSTEWLKYPAQKLANLIFSKRGSRLISEYDTAFFRAQQDLNARVLTHPRHGAAITHDDVLAHITLGTWKHLLPDGRLNTSHHLMTPPGSNRRCSRFLMSNSLSSRQPHGVARSPPQKSFDAGAIL